MLVYIVITPYDNATTYLAHLLLPDKITDAHAEAKEPILLATLYEK